MIQLLFRVVLILLIPLGGLLVGLHLVDDSFQAKRNTSIQLHHRAMSDLALDHAKARAAREVEAHQVSLEAKQRREQELIVAAGGPADHAVKDPDLNISQMLERLALACAPSGSRATVKVDRFTEFELVIDIESQAVSSVLGEMTTCVLSRAAPYLHTIRFTRQNTLIAELTPDSLASVGDWSLLKPGEAWHCFAQPCRRRLGVAPTPAQQNSAPMGIPPAGRRSPDRSIRRSKPTRRL